MYGRRKLPELVRESVPQLGPRQEPRLGPQAANDLCIGKSLKERGCRQHRIQAAPETQTNAAATPGQDHVDHIVGENEAAGCRVLGDLDRDGPHSRWKDRGQCATLTLGAAAGLLGAPNEFAF